jgi:hypothetical protein
MAKDQTTPPAGDATGGQAADTASDILFNPADLEALEESDTYVPERSVNIPDEIKEFVEKAYTAWQAAPTKWRHVRQSGESAANTLISAMKLYARDVRDEPLTVQVKTPYTALTDGTGRVEIVYRVREQIRRKSATTDTADAAPADNPPAE